MSSFTLLAAPAAAQSCSVQYLDQASVNVKDTTSSSLAGVVFGAVAAGVVHGISKSDDSEAEIFLKSKIKDIDTFEIIKSVHQNSEKFSSKSDNETPNCIINIKLESIKIDYGSQTIIDYIFKISKTDNGVLIYDKNYDGSTMISKSPVPTFRPRTYKKGSDGKYVEIIEKMMTKEESFEAFKEKYMEASLKIYRKMVKKYVQQN